MIYKMPLADAIREKTEKKIAKTLFKSVYTNKLNSIQKHRAYCLLLHKLNATGQAPYRKVAYG